MESFFNRILSKETQSKKEETPLKEEKAPLKKGETYPIREITMEEWSSENEGRISKMNEMPSRKKDEKDVLDRIIKTAKNAVNFSGMLTLLSLPLSARAQEAGNIEAKKYTIEETRANLETVKGVVRANSDFEVRKINGNAVDSRVFPGGTEVICSKDGGYVIMSLNDGVITLVDINGDGDVDRFLVNRDITTSTDYQDANNKEQRSKNLRHVFTPLENDIKAFGKEKTMESVFGDKGSEIDKMLMLDISSEETKAFDTETGEVLDSSNGSPENIEKMTKQCQKLYADTVADIVNMAELESLAQLK